MNTSAAVANSGFSGNVNQTRAFTAKEAGLKKSDMKDLDVAWALAFQARAAAPAPPCWATPCSSPAAAASSRSTPTTGCAKWSYTAQSRNTPTIGDIAAEKSSPFSAGRDIVVLDAATGSLVWKASGQPLNGTGGSIRGGVTFAGDKIIVPLSASGVGSEPTPLRMLHRPRLGRRPQRGWRKSSRGNGTR